jgi:menaquinone-dependent protoporphyrinogen IX oxidase
MAGKTLVAYATKGGATEEYANAIASELRKRSAVDVVNLRKTRIKDLDLSGYSGIVAGAGVRIGRIYGELSDVLRKDLSGKKVAVFIVCGEAGNPKDRGRVREKHSGSILRKHPGLAMVGFDVFGGRVKMFGKVSDNIDLAMAKKWAENVGKKLGK